MTAKNLDMRYVPAKGSRWMYDGRPIVVTQTVVTWHYESGEGSTTTFHADPRCFEGVFSEKPIIGSSFTPLGPRVEPGTVLKRDKSYNFEAAEFVVLEVDEVEGDDTYYIGKLRYTDTGGDRHKRWQGWTLSDKQIENDVWKVMEAF